MLVGNFLGTDGIEHTISCQWAGGPFVSGGNVNSAEPKRMSVLEPSSMIRIVIVPKWNESPDFAGTKLIGTLGVSMIFNIPSRI